MKRARVPAGVAMVAVTFGLARYGYGLLLPDMRAALAIDATTAGLIGSGVYVSYLVANTAVVPLTNRHGPRPPLLLATLTGAGGMVLAAVATDAGALAVGVVLAGAAAGFAFPPYADIVARVVRPRRRASAWAAISSGTGWGVAVAGVLAVVSDAGWRECWLAFALVAVVVGVVAIASVPAGNGAADRAVRLSARWFVCPRSLPLLAGAVLVGAASSVWWAFSVDAMQSGGVAAGTSRLLYAWCGVASVFASFTGAAVDATGLRRVHRWCCGALAASMAVLAGTVAVGSSSVVPLVVAAGLFGTSYNGVIAVQGLWSSGVFADRPSAGLAGVSTALTAGTVVGPLAGGAVIDATGYPTALAGAALCALVPFVLAPPRSRGPAPAGQPGSDQVPVS